MKSLGGVCGSLVVVWAAGCGNVQSDVTCGPGTKLVDNQCVVDDDGTGGAGAAGMSGGDGGFGAGGAGAGASSGGTPGPGGSGVGGSGSGGAGAGGSGGSGGGECADPSGITAGVLSIGPSDAVAALCGGRVLVGDKVQSLIREIDLKTGGTVASYALTAAPGDIVVDRETNKAYAALVSSSHLARIDLASGQVTEIALDAPALRLALGNDGLVFASLDDDATWPDRPMALIDGAAGVVEATIVDDFDVLIAFDRPGSQLVVGDLGISPSSLNRYAFDPVAKTLTHLEERWNSGSNGQDIAISPDGDHIAFPCGGGNGVGYTVFDFSTDDFDVTFGEWSTGPYPRAAAFGPGGKTLVASNGDEVILFDAATHATLKTFPLPSAGCSYSTMKRVSVSPGGKIVHAVVECGFDGDTGKLFWFVP